MPGGLPNSFGGTGSGSAPQPQGLNVSTPGYSVGTGLNANGQIGTNLTTGGSFGQNTFNTWLPTTFAGLGANATAAGTAGAQYLSDIGYSNTGTPSPNAPFLSPLANIENARQSALSTLSDSLARRGVLGSSFGSDQITQQDLAYQQLKSQAQLQIAGNVLQNKFATLDEQNKIIMQQTQLMTTALDKEFRDFAAANGLTTNFTDLTASLSAFDQKLAADQAAGLGSFFGSALGLTNGGLGSALLGTGGLTGTTTPAGSTTTPGVFGSSGALGWLGSLFGGGGAAGAGAGAGAAAGGGAAAAGATDYAALLAAGAIAL